MDMFTAYPPKAHRTHEVCGAGAYFFAFVLGARVGGTCMWVRERWRTETLNPAGFADILAPESLLLAATQDQTEVLAVAEETLRSATVPLVVMELSKPLDLTAGRRLQLAAKTGRSTALVLIPEGMGSHATQTRWRCEPVFDGPSFDGADSTLHRWSLIKNKSGTLGAWHVRWDHAAHRITVVSPAGE